MPIIQAIFENGDFRPVGSVDLPEKCEVEVHVVEATNGDPAKKSSRGRVYAILDESVETGIRDLTARHDEFEL